MPTQRLHTGSEEPRRALFRPGLTANTSSFYTLKWTPCNPPLYTPVPHSPASSLLQACASSIPGPANKCPTGPSSKRPTHPCISLDNTIYFDDRENRTVHPLSTAVETSNENIWIFRTISRAPESQSVPLLNGVRGKWFFEPDGPILGKRYLRALGFYGEAWL